MNQPFNPNGYEFIEIDPRVMGESMDEISPMNEGLDYTEFNMNSPFGNTYQPAEVPTSIHKGESVEELLKKILAELNEVKIILSGM